MIKNGILVLPVQYYLIHRLLSQPFVFPYTLRRPVHSRLAWPTFIHLITPITQTSTRQCCGADHFWPPHLLLINRQCLNSRPSCLVVPLLEPFHPFHRTEERQVSRRLDSEQENIPLRSAIFLRRNELVFDISRANASHTRVFCFERTFARENPHHL